MTREEAPRAFHTAEEAYESNMKRAHEALVHAKACLAAAYQQHADGNDSQAHRLFTKTDRLVCDTYAVRNGIRL